MKSFLSASRLAAVTMMTGGIFMASSASYAVDDLQPTITIKTDAYENFGESNVFTICIDTDDTIYLDVNCGFGSVEYEIEPSEEGTWIPCTVSPEGVVTMTTDHPELISYMYSQGGFITDIDLSKLTGLQILDLSNNSLGRLDLSNNTNLTYLNLGSNPFDVEPLQVGEKPYLVLLEMEVVGNISPDFNLSDYPELVSFAAFSSPTLRRLDPSGCPKLQRLSIDVTSVSTLDVSKNPELRILNIGSTPITSIDLSQNSKLEQLYVEHAGSFADSYKMTSLDISHNPRLIYLFAQDNALTSLDISNNPRLVDIYISKNYITSFDCSNNENLVNVNISDNCLDFATLPLDPDFGGEYYYYQRPMTVDYSFPVGGVLDMSTRVLREGTETHMELYGMPLKDPVNPVLIPKDYYSYDEGRITFHKEYADSVYASFTNPAFPECVLTTTNFMIKSQEAYGKPSLTAAFTPDMNEGETFSLGLGVSGASPETPKNVYVDCGDGQQVPVSVSSQVPDGPNVTLTRAGYAAVKIYVDDACPLTALIINDLKLYDIEVESAPELRLLELTNTNLSYINLERLRCLKTLRMTGNRFGTLSLETDILGYAKNVMEEVDLSNNQLTEIDYVPNSAVRAINLSHNYLSSLPLDKALSLVALDVSYNNFTEIDTYSLDSLQTLNVAGNSLTKIDHPWQNTLKSLDCRENNFTYSNLPYLPAELEGEYLYAPQHDIYIASKGPGANLSGVAAEVNDVPTEFVWHKENGGVLVEGKDYETIGGNFKFLDYDLGNVYCTMSNAVYPDFAGDNVLRTSTMLVAPPPTNEIGWFEVAEGPAADQILTLIGDRNNTTVFIDWTGEGKDYTEYLLGDTYRMFSINPVKGKRARVYTYEEQPNLKGFSLRGLSIKSADLSKMTSLTLLTLDDAGYKELIMPDTDNLEELSLDYNGLTSLDCSRLGNLRTLSLNGNDLKSFDLTPMPRLELAALAYNGMIDLKVNNPLLWDLDVSHNEFETFSFENLPALHQSSLASNLLTSINIEGPDCLRGLMLDNNRLTFLTLPVPTENLTSYSYGNQAPISVTHENMTVDLSWLYDVHGAISEFYWCEDVPYLDEDYNLTGYFLHPGVDYVVEEGVTTFLHDVANVCGVILSPLFPKSYMLTELMDITQSSVETIVANAATITVNGHILTISDAQDKEYGVYGIDGKVIAKGILPQDSVNIELPSAGVYLVKAGKASMKIGVK